MFWIILAIHLTFSFSLGSQHNFNRETKTGADMLGEPYDFNSIMHYGKYSFALDGKYS